MATQYPQIEPAHRSFIEAQHIVFVGTAAQTGRVNVSPKGMDTLRVMGPGKIVWRNLTGSGSETSGHLMQVNRMTLMWCSFTARPLILRAYGTAATVVPGDAEWTVLNGLFPPHDGARQIFDMTVDLVQTSCGYAVPFLDYVDERETLDRWTDDKQAHEGVEAYRAAKNAATIDGFPTGIAPA